MRAALWLLALSGIAVGLTLLARFSHGFVVIVLPPWRIELSLVLAVILSVLLGLVLIFTWRVLSAAIRLPDEVRRWRER
jgi:HemY protein